MSLGTGLNDVSALIRPNIEGKPRDITNRSTPMLDFLRSSGRIRQWSGGNVLKWNLTYQGNQSAELFTEFQAAPDPGKRSFATAQISPWYVQASAAVGGHTRDVVARGGAFEDIMTAEIDDGLKALLRKAEDTLMGSAQDKGIFNAIDAADTFANVAPGTISLWAAYEQGSIGALAVSDFSDAYVSITGADREGDVSVWLANVNQIRNYTDLGGPANANSLYRGQLPNGGGSGPFDLGMMNVPAAFNGAPLVKITTMPNSEILALDLVHDDPHVQMMRDVTATPLAKRGDHDEVLLTMGLVFILSNRKVHGKLTGITP